MPGVYRYRDERGRTVEAPVLGRPTITVRQRASAWRWRLSIKTLSASGDRERHDLEGDGATEEAAIDAARELLARLIVERKAAKAKLVKATTYQRGDHPVEVKRDCTSGRFVPARSKVNDCVIPPPKRHVPWWLDGSPVKKEMVCYPTRAEALRMFREVNWNAIDAAGGMDQVSSDGSWDGVNERYGLKGARRVKTVRQAIEAVMPPGKPYCLDRIDLETLNENRPIQEAGGLRLPDFVEEQKWLKRMERDYAQMGNE